MHYLLSLPPAAVNDVPRLEGLPSTTWHVDSDPVDQRLGSGGGSVHLLLSAWRKAGGNPAFTDWLQQSRKLMIHGGGQSRRLPAYAPAGKLFAPMPVWRWETGQRIDQTLLDLQRPYLERIFSNAPQASRLMIASGDVLVKFEDRLPPIPEADVICIGLWGKPEDAQHFGVFFCHRKSPDELAFFKQKPSATEIQQLSSDHLFLLDAGIWLLSERAIHTLLELGECPINAPGSASGTSAPFELYSDFGLGLGKTPMRRHSALNALTTAVIPIHDGEFYHFGRSSDLIHSSLQLQNLVLNQHRQRSTSVKRHPDLFVQNARIELPWTPENHRIWVENSHIGADWRLTTDHVLTGIPPNTWALTLPPGICLDIVPLTGSGDKLAIRAYGMHDEFRGPVGNPATTWLGAPITDVLAQHGINPAKAGLDPATDIQQAALFPVRSRQDIDRTFLQWLLAPTLITEARQAKAFAEHYEQGERISAQDLGNHADLDALYQQRRIFQTGSLDALARNHGKSVFYQTDLKHTAAIYASHHDLPLPPPLDENSTDLMTVVHDRMFRAEALRRRGGKWQSLEQDAFALLRRAVLEPVLARKVIPRCNTAPDQIVWARCPVRLDLAGGWTDTPPYCQLRGGNVVNLAVNLNGQPPLQAFIRRSAQPQITLRSIDLGSETRLTTYADIANCAIVGNEFSIAKAALAVAGFHPDFNGNAFLTLDDQLQAFGGGLEISFVAAVPKGSGLGTSSILATTILGAIGDFCGLNWTVVDACARTLALEQMLTSGGGWQDQFGAALHGVKLLTTTPGIVQTPQGRWLPEHMLTDAFNQGLILLYYTGITRIAKSILQDIVRGMFLNHKPHLALLSELGHHASHTSELIQTADWEGLCRAIGRSWVLNQQLDSGTNPPETQQLLRRIGDWTSGAKLLGAGGGGYLMICAKDATAAGAIRRELTDHPANPQARFVTPELSTTGLQITRS
ncbi:MAG TPA: bifunctional fucokinase/L-fucose-1-P-guanylyltransferase [Verrucomicrobia bacterium]|nr:bifunctional fucokinase/L-fucose-1-P-guanylyltransferase [Verrucomicrobiota bacterium]